MHCGKGVADRQVFLTKDGSQTDFTQSIISTELHMSFSKAQSRIIGIYDTKNARLRAVQREPVLSEADLRKFWWRHGRDYETRRRHMLALLRSAR